MRRVILVGLFGICGVIAVGLVVLFALAWSDRQYASSFEKIELGSTRDTVERRLGQPSETTKDCHVAQFMAYENPPRWTKMSTAVYCCHWIRPGAFGQFYAVGFSSDNKVVGIAYGDS